MGLIMAVLDPAHIEKFSDGVLSTLDGILLIPQKHCLFN
jgi:hypothetical protein